MQFVLKVFPELGFYTLFLPEECSRCRKLVSIYPVLVSCRPLITESTLQIPHQNSSRLSSSNHNSSSYLLRVYKTSRQHL